MNHRLQVLSRNRHSFYAVPRLVIRVVLALIVAFVTLTGACEAKERIHFFDSRIDVAEDRTLTVTETITVRAEARRIRHGIYRDFPLYYRDREGRRRRVGFEILEIRRDGRPAPWFTREGEAHVRIYIGRKDVFLKPGTYTYTIRYRTWRQIRSFLDHDELYWNVTGNFWDFTIEKARVAVLLPNDAPIMKAALYTGRLQERKRNAHIISQRSGFFSAETTRSLLPGEGFTIALAIPKGILAESEPFDWRETIAEGAFWWLLIGSLGVTGFLLWAWVKVGRDPPKGTIIPRWEPPAGLSPAATAWLDSERRQTFFNSQRAFSAALVSLAIKGYAQMDRTEDNKLRLIRQRQPDASLPPGERAIMDTLLSDTHEVIFSEANRNRIRAALERFSDALQAEYGNRFMLKNRSWLLAGTGLATMVILGFTFMTGAFAVGLLMVFMAFAVIFATVFFAGMREMWKRMSAIGRIGIAIFMLAFFMPFFLLPLSAMSGELRALLGERQSLLALLALLSLPLAVIVFWFLLPRPTLAGRRAMDELEGLELFIRKAEKPRLERLAHMQEAPEMSVATFERLFPYAIALGLESHWTRAFAEWLATAKGQAATGGSYRPLWFGGESFTPSSLSTDSFTPSTAISSAIASAMPRSSSSGFSSSGGSGGGGGGGGGGGW